MNPWLPHGKSSRSVLELLKRLFRSFRSATISTPETMKYPAYSAFALSVFVALAGCVGPTQDGKPNQIEMVVVAEGATPLPERGATEPAARHLSYVAYSGGYVEAGTPTGSARPATAAQVETALEEALASRGLVPATPGADPDLLLVVHWGVVARDSMEIEPPDSLSKTFTSRLALVATAPLAAAVEKEFLWQKSAAGLRKGYTVPRLLDPDQEAAVLRLDDTRYFAIVSAYDHAAARRGEAVQRWRTVLSAKDLSGWMSNVVPALFRSSTRFLGANNEKVATERIEVPAGPAPMASISPFSDPATTTAQLEEKFVRQLLATERVRLDPRAPKP